MFKCCVFIIVLVLNAFHTRTEAGLSIAPVQCGQKTCNYGEYCLDFENSCKKCSDICNNKTHNFDASLCVKNCQDYLHDLRFVSKNGNTPGNDDNLKGNVQKLAHMVTVTLALVCFILVILASVLLLQICRWMKKKNYTIQTIKKRFFSKKTETNDKTHTERPNQTMEKPDLRLDIPTSPTQNSDSPITTTTSISRRPTEDNTLDYAYDNPAMSGTPSPKSKPSESTF